YRLLTGRVPNQEWFDSRKSLPELFQMLGKRDPELPSSFLRSRGEIQGASPPKGTRDRDWIEPIAGDLDWIVAKCLENRPEDRYPSAAALADDLRRHLADQPVLARPPSRRDRVAKWVRRNRTLVAAASVVFATLTLGLAGTVGFALDAHVAKRRADNAADQANANARRATRNAARADANRQQALDAVQQYFMVAATEDLLDQPGLQPLRERLLSRALEFYERLGDGDGDDASLSQWVDARCRHAVLLKKLGRRDDALQQLQLAEEQAALAVQQIDPNATPAERFDVFINVARVSYLLGLQYSNRSEHNQAESHFNDALQWLENPPAWAANIDPLQPRSEFDSRTPRTVQAVLTANVFDSLSRLAQTRGQSEASMEYNQAGIQAISALGVDADDYTVRANLADLIEAPTQQLPREEAIERLGRVIEIRRRIVQQTPASLSDRASLARVAENLAWEIWREQPERAKALFTESEQLLEALHRSNPAVKSYRLDLARALDLHAFASHQWSLQDNDLDRRKEGMNKALGLYRRAEKLLLKNDPAYVEGTDVLLDASKIDESDNPQLLAMIYNGIALIDRDLNRPDASEAAFLAALEIQTALMQRYPDRLKLHLDTSGTLHNLGRMFEYFAQYRKAADYFRRALVTRDRLREEYSTSVQVEFFRASSVLSMGTSVLMTGDPEYIAQHYRPVTPVVQPVVRGSGRLTELNLREAKLLDRMRQLNASLYQPIELDDLRRELDAIEMFIAADASDGKIDGVNLLAGQLLAAMSQPQDPSKPQDSATGTSPTKLPADVRNEAWSCARQWVQRCIDEQVISAEEVLSDPLLGQLLSPEAGS
ncbi:MAG: hypothetical protein AAF958_16760, partial [Planctomycetota bacterium]